MQGTWTRIETVGKQVDLYEPPGPGSPRFGVLYLHDLNGESLRGRSAFTRLFDDMKLACVCPSGGPSWWSDRLCIGFDAKLTAERFLLDHAVPIFSQRWRLFPRSVGLLGIGMGGQGALRLAFRHAAQFPVSAAISPALDYHEFHGHGTPLDDMYDSKEQCRQDTALMHVPPAHYPPHIFFSIDPDDSYWYRGNDRLHEKLNALGIPHEFDEVASNGKSGWDYFDRLAGRAVSFMFQGLELESRRLL